MSTVLEFTVNGFLTDCSLISIDGTVYHLHSELLFRGTKLSLIDIKPIWEHIPTDILMDIVRHLYTGTCHLSFANIKSILDACSKLELWGMKSSCARFISKHMQYKDCAKYYNRARNHNWLYYKDLISEHARSFCQQSKEVIQSLSIVEIKSIMGLLTSLSEDEFVKLKVILCWLQRACPLPDKQVLLEMVNYIRIVLPEFNVVKTLAKNHKFEKILAKSLLKDTDLQGSQQSTIASVNEDNLYYYDQDFHSQHKTLHIDADIDMGTALTSYKSTVVLAGSLKKSRGKKLTMIDLKSQREFQIADLPEPLCGPALIRSDNSVYILGGFKPLKDIPINPDDFETSTHVYCLDLETQNWRQLPNMPIPVAWGLTANTSEHLYVIGGETLINQFTNKVQIFDKERETWSLGPPMPFQCCSYRSARVIHNHLITIFTENRSIIYDCKHKVFINNLDYRDKSPYNNCEILAAVDSEDNVIVSDGSSNELKLFRYEPLTDGVFVRL